MALVEVVAEGRASERDARLVVEVADGFAALLLVAEVADEDDELGVDVALLVCDEEEELETIGASAALLELLHAASDDAATRTDAAATVREVLRLVS